MANVKSIAHELLAKEILQGFKGKITGDNADVRQLRHSVIDVVDFAR